MATILEQMRAVVQEVIRLMGYPGIAVLMFLENIIPPIPSELVMPFAGFLVADDRMTFVGVLVAGTVGTMLGAVALYYLARKMGEERVRAWFRNHGKYLLLSEQDFNKAMRKFDDNGGKVVFLSRLVPGVRGLISIPAGLDEMPLLRFLLFTLVGTTIWNVILATAGVMLGRNWQLVLDIVKKYELILWGILAIFVASFLVRRVRARRS